jgi:hypothetical protein
MRAVVCWTETSHLLSEVKTHAGQASSMAFDREEVFASRNSTYQSTQFFFWLRLCTVVCWSEILHLLAGILNVGQSSVRVASHATLVLETEERTIQTRSVTGDPIDRALDALVGRVPACAGNVLVVFYLSADRFLTKK